MPTPEGFPPTQQEYESLVTRLRQAEQRADQKQHTADATQEQYTLATNERDALRIEVVALRTQVADLTARLEAAEGSPEFKEARKQKLDRAIATTEEALAKHKADRAKLDG